MRSKETDIARLYHAHSCHLPSRALESAVEGDATPQLYRTYVGAPRTALPGRDFALPASLGEVLERRQSIRDFEPGPLPLVSLGRLLFGSYGARKRRRLDDVWVYNRPAASAGARYPLEIYVATQSVSGLDDGIYHYDVYAHELELRRQGRVRDELVELTVQEMVRGANLVLVITAVWERNMWKYGQRGYRLVLLDAGHLGQNLYLVATALGLGPCGIGGFLDAELAALLELPEGEEPVYALCIGKPRRAAGDAE
ncbi:SagB/ThcOx family dehydrogenase [Sorangium sp. So ce834]|uniref:SagB/ThcOx family dehydrogenase n=1 Tax=Sorangium sp. So ce834 TaxID=3133321 RepID=UPI003F636DB6